MARRELEGVATVPRCMPLSSGTESMQIRCPLGIGAVNLTKCDIPVVQIYGSSYPQGTTGTGIGTLIPLRRGLASLSIWKHQRSLPLLEGAIIELETMVIRCLTRLPHQVSSNSMMH